VIATYPEEKNCYLIKYKSLQMGIRVTLSNGPLMMLGESAVLSKYGVNQFQEHMKRPVQ
jgi:hypothetical protein